jgi:uncharacterized protein
VNAATTALATAGLRVARFEFCYMASRRSLSGGEPPPRAETLKSEYIAAIDALNATGKLVIGGKSTGGCVASMIVDQLHASPKIVGLLCLSYPLHPIGKPVQLRSAPPRNDDSDTHCGGTAIARASTRSRATSYSGIR